MKKYGWTKDVTGGGNTNIIRITSLEDAYLRSAVNFANSVADPVCIVFDKPGRLELKRELEVKGSNTTIDGTGVTLSHRRLLVHRGSNIILKNIRHRLGSETDKTDCIEVLKSANVLVDHCSVGWSRDELISVVQSKNVTIQNCICGHPLHYEDHGVGPILGGSRIGFYNNIVAHCQFRPSCHGTISIVNNVFYNYGTSYPIILFPPQPNDPKTWVEVISNKFIAGPTTATTTCKTFRSINIKSSSCKLYEFDNLVFPSRESDEMCRPIVRHPEEGYKIGTAPMHGAKRPRDIQKLPPHIGAPLRDNLDKAIITDVYTRVGKHIQTENDMGGFEWLDS